MIGFMILGFGICLAKLLCGQKNMVILLPILFLAIVVLGFGGVIFMGLSNL